MLEYDLSLEVDYPSDTFRGRVRISGLTPDAPVELDAVDLVIDAVHSPSGSVGFVYDSDRKKLRPTGGSDGGDELTVDFAGRVASGVQTGFFVSRLGDRKVFTTQMEPESCRRLFPCIDRPAVKARVRLRVTTGPGLVVVSNMPADRRRSTERGEEWTFPPTPPMSTYLFYLGVGPFEETAADVGGLPVIVAAPPGISRKARNAARLAAVTVRGYAEYYGVPYPLPKLHLVALTDFWVAMENWGAIAGSEGNLMFDESTAPDLSRFIQETIAHEVAHQWFGNLVTLRTWDDLWLNESFATFTVPRIQERARLREDPWGEFVLRARYGDLPDSMRSAHPVKPGTVDPTEIMQFADEITYFKGSRLLRMIEGYLGEETFRQGVSAYLRRHQFANATSDDLWKALEEVSGRTVVSTMRSWVERPGLPCLRFRQVGASLEIDQRRFLYLPASDPESPWPVPLTLEMDGERRTILFDAPTLSVPHAEGAPLRVDPDRTGYFRVLFDPPLLDRILTGVAALSPLDRWGLVHDAEAFLLSGDYSLAQYARVLDSLAEVPDTVSVLDAVHTLEFLHPVLEDLPEFVDLVRKFGRTHLDRIRLAPRAGEPEHTRSLRERTAVAYARVDEPFGRSLAAKFDRIQATDPSLHWAITMAYARYGPPDDWGRLLEQAREADAGLAFFASLAMDSIRGRAAIAAALDEALAGRVRHENLFYFLRGLARNTSARSLWWEWFTENSRSLERRLEGGYQLSMLFDQTIPLLGLDPALPVAAYFDRERFAEGSHGIRVGRERLEVFRNLRARLLSRDRAT